MRNLTETLLAAQQAAAAVPYVGVTAKNQIAGVVRCDWSRLYTGSEDDYYHALTMPGDGSLVRARLTLPADSRKLYYQRVASPGAESDFSQWTYAGQYNVLAVAAASLGAEVSIFWINLSREIRRIKSSDYGASWGSPELIDYSPTTVIGGLAAAYKAGGDLALFFADQATLYVKKCLSGQWQSKTSWDKTTGDLSGLTAVYQGDWDLLITGEDAPGNYKLWSLVYGDGGDVAAGVWSALRELASAPSGGDFAYRQPFLDMPDVYRAFYVEKYTGSQSYSRPFWSHAVLDTAFADSLWREPVPMNLPSEYGLAIAHHGDYCWLSCPFGVWRSSLAAASLELTGEVIGVSQEAGPEGGTLVVELNNDRGQFNSPGQGLLSVLDTGCQLDFSPGYITASGGEVSGGQAFFLEGYEHYRTGGRASLFLRARDGWSALALWRSRCQFRWNQDAADYSVKDILAFVLARAGLKLEVKSQSAVITGFYPDFTIGPGDAGNAVVAKLLSFVPDALFIEGSRAYLVNPQAADSAVYSYGLAHPVLEGSYRAGAWETSRVQVEGYDAAGGSTIIVDSFAWDEIDRCYDRWRQVPDRNLGSVAEAQARGDACLRRAAIGSGGGAMLVPVNCGQQLYDVIAVTDSGAGQQAARKRVLGWRLVYQPRRGEYHQRLQLGAV